MANKPDISFNSGPSQLMPQAADYISQAVEELGPLSHRSEQFEQVFMETDHNLRRLLNIPESYRIFYTGSATSAMQIIQLGLVHDRPLHLVNGAFSKRWHDFSEAMNKRPVKEEIKAGEGFNLYHPLWDLHFGNREIDEICFTENETSAGTQLNRPQIESVMEAYKDPLVITDITSGVPYLPVSTAIDGSRAVDAAFFSVQKGFGLPAGLGVIVAGPDAVERSRRLEHMGKYTGGMLSLHRLADTAYLRQTPETPNMIAIYALGKIALDMLGRGRAEIVADTELKAGLMYDFLENHDKLTPFVKKPEFRSQTVIVADYDGSAKSLINNIAEKYNVVIGAGYGSKSDRQIRIGNFVAHSLANIKDLLAMLKESAV